MDAYNNGMNNGMMEGHELDWDGVIEEDDEYIILPPDDYNFVIKGYRISARIVRDCHGVSADKFNFD